MFRVQVPQMGIEQPFLMHLLLALASRHIQFLTSEENKSTHYADAAEKHFAIALPQVTQALTRLDHQNCQVFYISSLLICWYMFSRGPSPGEYLVFSDHGPPMWLPLLRGVRTIRETEGFEGGFNNTASKSADKFPNADAPTAVTLNLPRVSWQKRFQELGELISATAPTDSVEIYLVAHDRLARNYEATYGDDENRSYNGNAIHQMIFQWLYLMDDEFVDRMQQKKPHALLIVANFALLINLYDLYNCWFLRGWATHILWGIYHSLEDDYRVWMQWPMEAAGIEWSPLSLRSGDHGKGTA
ncbi:hypothetical protein N7467_002778 [Penicillium canescens]|nr:hypothetical protein N7467_002778 [Penicillium canescens]